MIRFKTKVLMCLLISIFFLVGCWDMIEIDRRLFVGIVGIDTGNEEDKYTFEFSFPIAREIVGGEGGGKTVATASTVGSSIIDAARNLALRLNRDIFFEHMRIVVIGEDVARENIKNVINPLTRQTEFNRRSRIAICSGKAKKVLEVVPWTEKLKAEYMESIYSGTGFSGKFIDLDLGGFLSSLHTSKGNALVSKIKPNKTEVYVGGAAVIKDYRMVGWLDEEETQGVNFFMGKIRGGDIVVKDPQGSGSVTFTILGQKRKLSVKTKEPVPDFSLEVYLDGNIASTTHGVTLELDEVKRLQDMVSKEVMIQIAKGIEKLRDTYRVDLLELSEHLYKYEPDLWKKYEKNWEDTFPDVKININVYTTVKNIGVIQ